MYNIYNIPSALSFVDSLARGILSRYEDDPFGLISTKILLPNRRSCTALREAFLRASNKPLLLPKISSIGDLEELDVIDIDNEFDLLPVISPTKKRLLLTKLIESWQKHESGDLSQSAYLAVELESFINEVETEQLTLDKLQNIVPEDLAGHWQITLDFLKIIFEHWPHILEGLERLDSATYRNMLLEKQADYWQKNPPKYKIIAAGSTGTILATRKLLKAICQMENGEVILPGLDQYLDDDSWEKIEESHPQFAIKELIDFIGVDRKEIKIWNNLEVSRQDDLHHHMTSELMRPAETSEKWMDLKSNKSNFFGNIKQINSANIQEEASIISYIMRQKLEEDEKVTALITNDKNLSRRVASILAKWGINIDDSSGYNLANTPNAVFFRNIIQVVKSNYAPIDLLTLLKHPLCRCNLPTYKFKSLVRNLEKTSLRGIRKPNGLDGLINYLENIDKDYLSKFLAGLKEIMEPINKLFRNKQTDLDDLIITHIKIAEILASDDKEDGQIRVWKSEEGQQFKEFIDELILSSKDFGPIKPNDYLAIFDSLLIGKKYRPKYGSHPRLMILSPMEARIQKFDNVILGGLNEGNWPLSVKACSWMNRPMRKEAGLSLPEKKIGQMAHDFIGLLSADEVYLTRSEKVDGTQTIASRWLLRLKTILDITGDKSDILNQHDQFQNIYKLMNRQNNREVLAPPEVRPDRDTRPLRLSVTNIENLMRDPYSIYAYKILKLNQLDDIDKEPSHLEFGNFIHLTLDKYLQEYQELPYEKLEANLLKFGDQTFKAMQLPNNLRHFWWSKFLRISKWFIEKDLQNRAKATKIASEVTGEYRFPISGNDIFTLYATADRLEQQDCYISIIDYKTGSLPAAKDLELGFSPQLPLEALIAEKSGFGQEFGISNLTFWKLSGANPAAEERNYRGNLDDLIYKTEHGLKNLIKIFYDENTAYISCPDPNFKPKYNKYEHLARVKEWENNY